MGGTRQGRRDQDGGRPLTYTAARVVPNVPTFSVDNGFWYSIPDHLSDLEVGAIVRVGLGGRRVRGWVVELGNKPPAELKPVVGVSGSRPAFDRKLLETLLWSANHYVAPVSVVLAKATPPNLPRVEHSTAPIASSVEPGNHPLSTIADAAATGRRLPTQAILGRWHSMDWFAALAPLLTQDRSVLVISGTAAEVHALAAAAKQQIGSPVVEVAGGSDSEVTSSWEKAQIPGTLLIGTPRTALWHVAELAMIVVLDEGRRAMKERQTPTIHVREVVRRRGLIEGLTTVFFGPTPSLEVLSAGAEPRMIGNRAWPHVEAVDRSEEPPGSGLLAPAVIAALSSMSSSGRRSFVLGSRRMLEDLVKEINARLGTPTAGLLAQERLIIVGSERDLAGLAPVSLAIASNPDGMLLGRGYRTREEVLRVLARLANALKSGSGHRMMVQTADPQQPLMETLRRGDPLPYLEDALIDRSRSGLPPSVEMIAVEIRGDLPSGVAHELGGIEGADVIGPVEVDDGLRWLLQGSLTPAREVLRGLATRWRGAGATLRIDVDPIDL